MKNIESNLVGFLIERCAGELSQSQAEGVAEEEDYLDAKTILLDSRKLKILGILWSQGVHASKLQELAKLMNFEAGENSGDAAILTDQKGKKFIKEIYYFSSIVIFEHTQRVNDQYLANMTTPLPYPTVNQDKLQKYKDMFDAFLTDFLASLADVNSNNISVATSAGPQS